MEECPLAVALLDVWSPPPISVPQKLLEGVSVDFSALPIDLDHRTEMVLRKAHLLANDWNIDRPFAFRSVEQMNREIAAWQENNSALASLMASACFFGSTMDNGSLRRRGSDLSGFI